MKLVEYSNNAELMIVNASFWLTIYSYYVKGNLAGRPWSIRFSNSTQGS